jgi:hypothetical protein
VGAKRFDVELFCLAFEIVSPVGLFCGRPALGEAAFLLGHAGAKRFDVESFSLHAGKRFDVSPFFLAQPASHGHVAEGALNPVE